MLIHQCPFLSEKTYCKTSAVQLTRFLIFVSYLVEKIILSNFYSYAFCAIRLSFRVIRVQTLINTCIQDRWKIKIIIVTPHLDHNLDTETPMVIALYRFEELDSVKNAPLCSARGVWKKYPCMLMVLSWCSLVFIHLIGP